METQNYKMSQEKIESYREWLIDTEKSTSTVEKYIRDISGFYKYLPQPPIVTKKLVLQYKAYLSDKYAVTSLNSMLIAINGYFDYCGWPEMKVKLEKCQRSLFCEQERELDKEDYFRLVNAARSSGNDRLMLVIECICSTGIRVSELAFITVKAVQRGRAEISLKGKTRVILLPSKLCEKLLTYTKAAGIVNGCIFKTKHGNVMNRSNIWRDMKALCTLAEVDPSKVYPHNLRHLFARTFYQCDKDIVRLADVLGHSSVETTRIYTISSGEEHIRKINQLDLVI